MPQVADLWHSPLNDFKMIVIHASLDDAHADAVANCLHELEAKVFVARREQCFVDWSIDCHDDEVSITNVDGCWKSKDISAVLWRRDYIVEPAWVQWKDITPQVKDFLAEQRSIHVDSAFKRLASSCGFINDLDANRRCSSKALQHHVARQCGLNVPKTYVGSDRTQAEQFVRHLWSDGRKCCTKNIESTHVEIDGVKHARLTKMFHESNLPDLSGLAACPMFFQEYIEKQFEYRVTIVGQDVFVCRIDSQAAGGETAVDWRNYNIPSTPHYADTLGTTLNGKLVQLVERLGLTYGAIDLVENPQGEFFFLEINSMGQWLWIEDLTELPISMSIARHLASPQLIRR